MSAYYCRNLEALVKKLLTLILLTFSTISLAEPGIKLESSYYQVDRNVKIVITNQPCVKFTSLQGKVLGYAYAINTDTSDEVTGCFDISNGIVHIELSSDDNVEHYTYEYFVERFLRSEVVQ